MSFSLLKSMVGKLNGCSLRKGLEEGGHQQLQHRQLANRLSLARSVRMPLQRLRRLLRQPVRLLQMLPRLHQHVQVLLLVPVLQLLLKCNHRHRQQLCLACLLNVAVESGTTRSKAGAMAPPPVPQCQICFNPLRDAPVDGSSMCPRVPPALHSRMAPDPPFDSRFMPQHVSQKCALGV